MSSMPIDETEIRRLITKHVSKLECPPGIDPVMLLLALWRVESSSGQDRIPRFEPAYAPGGYYYKKAEHVRRAYTNWGAWACCSYSGFQILFITARELGFYGTPGALWDDRIAIIWVIEYLNRRTFGRDNAATVEQVADSYNSGTHRDNNIPEAYIQKFVEAYSRP